MEFISGYHYHYEFFKFLKQRGTNFTTTSLELHPLDPNNANNFLIRCNEDIASVAGAPRFSTDDQDMYDFYPLTENNAQLDAFIATQLALPVLQRKFPYEVILRVNGHVLKVTNSSSGRRPTGVFEAYPQLVAEIVNPHWDRSSVQAWIVEIRAANLTVPATVNLDIANNSSAWNYIDPVKKWTNVNTFVHNPEEIDSWLATLNARYESWKSVTRVVCLYNQYQAQLVEIREQERIRREREAQAERERLEREKRERERLKILEGFSRIETRAKAFQNFAHKRENVKRSAHENLEKFLLMFDSTNIQVVEAEAEELTPSAVIEYPNGLEVEIVASETGVFIKNFNGVKNMPMLKHILEMLKSAKE